MKKAMLIDTDLCLDCNACTVECKRANDVPVGDGIAWTKIEEIEVGTYPNVRAYFIKTACKHCTEASCMNVCPVGAISKPDGVHVVVNQEWCIGCGYCEQACPFGIPHFGEPKGSMQKCRFCYGTKAEDEPTACAAACPFGAITFGERNELIEIGHQRISQLQQKGHGNATLYGEKELGGLNVLYVLADQPSVYGLPETPGLATTNQLYKWLAGIASAAVITVVPFWWLFRRRKQLEAEQKSKVEGGTR